MGHHEKFKLWTFDNFALLALAAGLLLLPVFTLPFWGLPLDLAKRALIAVVVFVAFILWLLGRLQEGHLILPRNFIVVGGFIIVIISSISALFSGAFWNSFTGLGYELDTVLSILPLVLLIFLYGVYFQSRKRFLSIYIGIFVVAFILFLAELASLIILRNDLLPSIQTPLALIFSNLSATLIGKWYDFGIYAGFILLSAVVMLEFFSLKEMPIFHWFIRACFVLSLLILILVNYQPVWMVIGIAGLILFVYKISYWGTDLDKDSEKHRERFKSIFIPSFLIVIIALLFITIGSQDKLGRNIDNWRNRWGVPIMETKPSWQGTWQLAQKTLSHNPVLGAGPNRFVDEWVKYKPQPVNETIFWNVDFRFGVGLIPSMAITTGLLGFVSWIVFFMAIVWYGVRFIFSVKQDKSTRALLLLSFLGSVYLWIFTIIYVPDNALFALAFLITGLFVAILTDTKIIKNAELSLVDDPRLSFVSILLFVSLIISSIAVGYLTLEKYLSLYIYQKGLYVFSVSKDLDKTLALISWADNLSHQDLYKRTLAEINTSLAGRLLSTADIPKEELRVRFLAQADAAIKEAKAATELNSLNYLNWLSLGRVYEALVPLGIDRAYDEGKKAFGRARELNPTNPSILVDYFARLAISNKDISEAKKYALQSLTLKNNYPQAVSLLSQIDTQEGNADIAIRRLQQFLATYPQYADAGLYFQLGYLEYKSGNYQAAAAALNQAVGLVPNFANAKYFLGLALRELGDQPGALQQFTDIQGFNQDNQEIRQLIYSLQSESAAKDSATSTVKKAN